MIDKIITVIVPAYNHEKYILECLDSIHNQTYRDFQWIVVDDCSSDKTPQILLENQEKYGYELIMHKENVGISATLTDTIKNHARGELITMCASDDMYLPNRIEEQVKFMQAHPEYAMSYSKAVKMDVNSVELPRVDDFSKCKSGFIFEDVICRMFPIGIGVIYRKQVLEELGYYANGIMAEDYYLHCKIAQKYQIGFLDQYLSKYRVAELSTKRDPWKLISSHKQTIETFNNEPIFRKALRYWEIRSAGILIFYKKYKLRSIWFVLKNFDYYIARPKELISNLKILALSWK